MITNGHGFSAYKSSQFSRERSIPQLSPASELEDPFSGEYHRVLCLEMSALDGEAVFLPYSRF